MCWNVYEKLQYTSTVVSWLTQKWEQPFPLRSEDKALSHMSFIDKHNFYWLPQATQQTDFGMHS